MPLKELQLYASKISSFNVVIDYHIINYYFAWFNAEGLYITSMPCSRNPIQAKLPSILIWLISFELNPSIALSDLISPFSRL